MISQDTIKYLADNLSIEIDTVDYRDYTGKLSEANSYGRPIRVQLLLRNLVISESICTISD